MKRKITPVVVCLSLGLLTLVPAGHVRAEDAPPLLLGKDVKDVVADLEAFIPELMKKGRVPGLQAALIREGKIVWHKSFGVKNFETGELTTDETIFEAASLTKPFFAYAVMKLVEAGKLDLDTPLHTLLPPEKIEELLGHPVTQPEFKRDWFEKITARHVLSHSSGMPHGESGKVYPLFFEPGTQYKYSASGYEFLQRVVEHMTGENLETFMQRTVLDPLGMTRSCLVWRGDYEKTMASGHGIFNRPEAFRKRSQAYASATLYTTADDYARFVCAVLNGQGLEAETLKTMLTPQIEMDKDRGLTWSLGFGIQNDSNGPAFWQWGDYGIFRNYILAYSGSKNGVVYLTNSFHGLSICPEMVGRSIGGQALGNASLGYDHWDSPLYTFVFALKEQGAAGLDKLYAEAKALQPDRIKPSVISWIASLFADENRSDIALALFELNVRENPESAQVALELGQALLQQGKAARARGYLEKARELDTQNKLEAGEVDWALAYVKALEEPLDLPADYLETLAGDYETRHIELRDDGLYYIRDESAGRGFRKLVPLTKDTFVITGVPNFTMKFEFGEEGRPIKIVGTYVGGYRDESLRTK